MAVRLSAEMEKRLGHIVPVALLFKFPTVAQLASELQPNGQKQSSPVIAVQPGGSKPPFFCVHGYNAYLHIARALGPDRPFYGLGQHFAGRRVRYTRVEDQAKDHLKEVYAIQPRGPYYLAGHSLGGLIAYEMAQLLQNDGHEVAFLGLIDTVFPKQPKATNRRLRDRVTKCWYTFSGLAATDQSHSIFQSMKVSAQWRLKAIQCYGYHFIGKTLSPELLAFYVDEILFRHKYLKDQGRYQPKPYNGRVHYFRAAQSLNDVEKWKSVTDRELVVHEIPGTHLTMIEDTGAVELARTLKSCLEEACVAPQRFSYPATYPNDAKVTLPTMVFQRTTIRR
jgi:thioesterase domain-containing protein